MHGITAQIAVSTPGFAGEGGKGFCATLVCQRGCLAGSTRARVVPVGYGLRPLLASLRVQNWTAGGLLATLVLFGLHVRTLGDGPLLHGPVFFFGG